MRRLASSTFALAALLSAGAAPGLAETQQASVLVAPLSSPCAGTPAAQFPEPGAVPLVQVRIQRELQGWQPMECNGFRRLDVNTLVVTLGRFRVQGGVDAIAARLAKVSALTTIMYYPDDEDGWRRLFAAAVPLPDGPAAPPSKAVRRADFAAGDLQPGRSMRYSLEENSLLRPTVYRLTIRERAPDRLVYTVVNESEVGALFIRAIDPGEMRHLYVLQRDEADPSGELWRFSSFVEARTQGVGASLLPPSSYRSRAIAYFRYMAGIPTDLERRGER